jgi:hypothetical protein
MGWQSVMEPAPRIISTFYNPNGMLKKPASVVLASFRSSTYPRGYASGPHSLRPCWTAFLSILLAHILRLDVGYYSRNQRRGCGLTGA